MNEEILMGEQGGGTGESDQAELGKRLLEAASANDINTVVNLLHYGAPFVTDWWGRTALHLSALNGHLEMINLLIRSGILKDTKSKVDKTALHMACQEGHTAVATYLIAQGAQVNAADMIKMTPLHWAVENNHLDTVNVLLQNGAQVNAINKFEKTPIDIAVEYQFEEILRMLKVGNTTGVETVVRTYSDMNKHRPGKSIKVEPSKADTDAWQILEEHGIEMLEGEDVNIVASALGSGQTVYVTEAGRQALNLTEESAPEAIDDTEPEAEEEELPAPTPPKKKRNLVTIEKDERIERLSNHVKKLLYAKSHMKALKKVLKRHEEQTNRCRINYHLKCQEVHIMKANLRTALRVLQIRDPQFHAELTDSESSEDDTGADNIGNLS